MTTDRTVERQLSSWLETREAGTHYPDRLLSAAFEQTRAQRQARPRPWRTPSRFRPLTSLAAAGATIAIAVAGLFGLNVLVNQLGPAASPTPSPSPTPPDLGIFAPAAGRIVINGRDGIYATDPARAEPPIKLTTKTGTPLEFTADGTRLLIQAADGNLAILHADG